MAKTILIPDNREGFSMQVRGVQLNRPDLHMVAADLGIATKDVLFANGTLTIYNTSEECRAIVEDNALVAFIAMALDMSPEDFSNITPVKAKPQIWALMMRMTRS